MKKRILIAIFLVIVFCFSVAACSTTSESAYDIAVRNGFSGTEVEWLESLKGANGTNGKDAPLLDIDALYNAFLLEYPNAAFSEFLSSLTIKSISYDIQIASAKGLLSIVSIHSTFTARNSKPGQTSTSEYSTAGSGVIYKIIDGYAYIITNYHVVYDRDSTTTNGIAKTITVYSYALQYDDRAVSAEFIGGSVSKDIALLKVATSNFYSAISAVELANSDEVRLGETVIAIGNPSDEGISVTSGIISVDSEEIEMEALNSASSTIVMRVIRTDTPINSGNSGGGLFNTRGELLGIVNAKTIDTGVENIGFAIPINVAAGIADCIIENNSTKCLLGVTINSATDQVIFNSAEGKIEIIQSMTVESTTAGGLSDGRLLAGDIIKSIRINDGGTYSITRFFQISDYLYKVRSGDKIYIEVIRNNELQTIVLNPQPANFTEI